MICFVYASKSLPYDLRGFVQSFHPLETIFHLQHNFLVNRMLDRAYLTLIRSVLGGFARSRKVLSF
jgi:hypothetical protein